MHSCVRSRVWAQPLNPIICTFKLSKHVRSRVRVVQDEDMCAALEHIFKRKSEGREEGSEEVLGRI